MLFRQNLQQGEMSQFIEMDKVAICAQPAADGKAPTAIPKNYQTYCSDVDDMTTGTNGFLENDQKKLFPECSNYFGKIPINLQWKDITLKTKKGTTILNNLNGFACSGELTAIIGPSGAGKTSLLNVLSGFTQLGVTGQILLNGVDRDMVAFRKLTCYILQKDYIWAPFTVRELVTIASRLKIPSTVPEKERQKAVDNCIHSLGLFAQRNQRANTLSGGQRKQLCIAQEIVSNPPLIFLDEPTSGLDSSSCLRCMQHLKSLAEEGRNVICTIHQPNSRIYEIFDKLYMISGGQCIYRGSTKNLLPFLANQGLQCPKYHSPTDFIMDIAIGLYGDWNWKLKTAIDSSVEMKNNQSEINWNNTSETEKMNCLKELLFLCRSRVGVVPKESWLDDSHKSYANSFWNQFVVLFKKNYLTVVREPMNLRLKLISSTAFGLLLGSLYYGTGNDGSLVVNTAGLFFTLTVFLILTAEVPTILTFPIQRTIFEREHLNGWYSTKSYYLAKTAAEIPFQIIFPIITCSLIYWLTGQPAEASRFCLFLLSAVMISLIAESIGLAIGAGFSVQNGTTIAGGTLLISLGLCGMLLPFHNIPLFLRWLCHFDYVRYALQSIFLNIYMNRQPFNCTNSDCTFEDPMEYVRHIDMNGNIVMTYCAMLAFLFIFRYSAYLVLRFKVP